jgi:photosystem II stability/assembly factor-like uncharacterized protein
MKIKLLVLSLLALSAQAQWSESTLRTTMNSSYMITALHYDGTVLWAGSRSQVYNSLDGGTTWNNVSAGINALQTDVKAIQKLGNYVYVAFGGNGNKQIYRTQDNGQNWALDTAGHSQFQHVTNFYTHKDYLIAKLETNFILYKKNTDAQWSTLQVPDSRFITPVCVFTKGDTLVIPSGQGTPSMALTTDMGQNWTIRATNWGPDLPANGNLVFNAWLGKYSSQQLFGFHQGFVTTPSLRQVNSFIKSYDGMETFTAISGFDSTETIQAMWAHNNTLFMGQSRSIVYRSNDGGSTWTNITGNITQFVPFLHLNIIAMELVNGKLFVAGNSNGLLVYETGLVSTPELQPQAGWMVLPNPARDFLKIDHLPNATDVKIFNAYGQMLLHQTNTLGAFETSTANWPRGMYLIQVTAAGRSTVQKILLQD